MVERSEDKVSRSPSLYETTVRVGSLSIPFGCSNQGTPSKCKALNEKIVEEIKRSLYVDDLISGGETTDVAREVKQPAHSVFSKATFELHKWHSNVRELEAETTKPEDEEQSYANQQLGVKTGESKLLGVPWNKETDGIQVNFPALAANLTNKRHTGKNCTNLRPTRAGITCDPGWESTIQGRLRLTNRLGSPRPPAATPQN